MRPLRQKRGSAGLFCGDFSEIAHQQVHTGPVGADAQLLVVALEEGVIDLSRRVLHRGGEGGPVLVVVPPVRGQLRGKKFLRDGVPAVGGGGVQGVAQLNQPHQIAGVLKPRVLAGGAGGDAHKVGLPLGGDHPLVGHLVGDGGWDQAGGGVDVHIGLPGEGEVHTRKTQNALEAGEEVHGLGAHRLHIQARKFPCQLLIHLGILRKAAGEIFCKVQLLIPPDLGSQPGGLEGEVLSDSGQLLHGIGPDLQAAALSEGGGVVGGVPQPAQPRPEPQPHRSQGQQAAHEISQAPPPDQEHPRPNQPEQVPAQEEEDEDLHHGEGEEGPNPPP